MRKYKVDIALIIIFITLAFILGGIKATINFIEFWNASTQEQLKFIEQRINELEDDVSDLETDKNTILKLIAETDEDLHYLHERFEYVQRNYSKLTHEEINLLIEDILELSLEE